MNERTDIAIIGAGPYGLSLAAHLGSTGTPFRIFGSPMKSWQGMPSGMYLKSDGFASDIFDPDCQFTLRNYCANHAIPYAGYGMPIPATSFIDYGLAFQRQLVPHVENRTVRSLARGKRGFTLEMHDGEQIAALSVVVATGITAFEYVPPELQLLGAEYCSHSSAHHDVARHRGRDVIVIGGGASALDLAGLMHKAGVAVTIVARREIVFHRPPTEPSLWRRIRSPNFGLGPGLRSALCTVAPDLFHMMPAALRLHIVRTHLGPSAGWFVRELVENKVRIAAGHRIEEAKVHKGRVILRCLSKENEALELHADHVIAGTGYRVALPNLPFLTQSLLGQIEVHRGGSPVLSRGFESSVPGLYFVGLAAAATFGPLQRFALGARFASRRVTRYLGTRLNKDLKIPSIAEELEL